jgi:hypothetical protein
MENGTQMTNTKQRARIRKGVRPYSGRTFDVARRETAPNGTEYVDLDMTALRGNGGLWAMPSLRRYRLDEVELLLPTDTTETKMTNTKQDDASTAPRHATERTFRSQLVEDDGEAYIVLIEREVVGKRNTWPGNPEKKQWREDRVSLTLPELRKLAAKYLKETK